MNVWHRIKAALIFSRHQAWADEPEWVLKDAAQLASFLDSDAGRKLKQALTNVVLRQQAHALNRTDGLVFEAGYCAGQKGLVAVIEAMADASKFTEPGEQDDDPATNQPTS